MKVNVLLFDSMKRCVVVNENAEDCLLALPNLEQSENESITDAAYRVLEDVIGINHNEDVPLHFAATVQGTSIGINQHTIVRNDYYIYGVLPSYLEGVPFKNGMIWYQIPDDIELSSDELKFGELILTILSVRSVIK